MVKKMMIIVTITIMDMMVFKVKKGKMRIWRKKI